MTLAKGPVTLALKLNEVSGYAAALAQRARPRRRREAMLVELAGDSSGRNFGKALWEVPAVEKTTARTIVGG